MTEIQMTQAPTPDLRTWFDKDREHRDLNESLRPDNKTALFDALAAAGIDTVLVNFDGYGDSGQIGETEAKAGDVVVELPAVDIELARTEWGSPDITRSASPMRDVIEQLAYDFLEDTHGGWEINEGSFGDFIFDVAGRTITLDYNERIETSEYSQHVF